MAIIFEAYCDECRAYEDTQDFGVIQAFNEEHKNCLLRDQPRAPMRTEDHPALTHDALAGIMRKARDNFFASPSMYFLFSKALESE